VSHADILDRLRIDAGQRTIGQLIQDREAARLEIVRLQTDIERLRTIRSAKATNKEFHHNVSDTPFRIFIRLAEVCEMVGVARSTIYKWVSEGTFPRPVHISDRAVRWPIDAIESWRNELTRTPP
jgi:predicted DNA-binding transcriptional regulator AlpA